MSNKIKEIVNSAKKDISGKWISLENAELIVEATAKECVSILETSHSVKHAAYTTYDAGVVDGTISRGSDEIRKQFNLKKENK